MSRARHDGVVASATSQENGVTVVPYSDDVSPGAEDRLVSFDGERGEAVVSVHATTPIDYMVGSSIALASPRLLDAAIGVDGFDDILQRVPGAVLRSARNIGYLTDAVLNDAEAFRDMLVEWGRDVAGMSRQLRNGEYDDRSEFLSALLRDAHGLAGCVVHLLDAAGVDVVRELRVPDGVNSRKLEALAESVTHSVLIQSKYESFVAYRQLFEADESKRSAALSPDVDACDPFGEVIGSVVVRGGSAVRFEKFLVSELRDRCGEEHEDAPEFRVDVPVGRVSDGAFAVALQRVLNRKCLRVTGGAVRFVRAVVDSPVRVVEAFEWLGDASGRREVRADEVRFAVSKLSACDVLSECAGSIGEIVVALLGFDECVTQAELCEAVGVSGQTVRNHREFLVSAGLMCVTDDGYRAGVSFRSERGGDVFPVFDRVSSGGGCVWSDGEQRVFEALRRDGEAGDGRSGGGEWCRRVVSLGCADVSRQVPLGEVGADGVDGDEGTEVSGEGSGGGDGSESGGGDDGDGGVVELDFSGVSITGNCVEGGS